jgi:hypothetical protein
MKKDKLDEIYEGMLKEKTDEEKDARIYVNYSMSLDIDVPPSIHKGDWARIDKEAIKIANDYINKIRKIKHKYISRADFNLSHTS